MKKVSHFADSVGVRRASLFWGVFGGLKVPPDG
jgi:hypothetical protein